jgi:TRAP-type uncharacterized transport system fused permease subunit
MKMADSKAGEPATAARPSWRLATDILAALVTLAAIAWALALPRQFGYSFYPQQFLAAVLMLALPLAFLTLPARRGAERTHVPWYDILAALLAFGALAWITFRYPQIVNVIFMRAPSAWVPGVIVILLLLEALRRATGWALVIIILVFLAYALFGDMVPGRLQGRAQNWQLLAGYMAVDSNGILGCRSTWRPSSSSPSSCLAVCSPRPAAPPSSRTPHSWAWVVSVAGP